MADFPAMPFYTDAYLADTTHLTAEEHGAYMLLLIASWRSPGCCLRDDDRFLARVAKVSLERWFKRIKPVLLPFWQVEAGIWTQKKQQKIRQNLGAISQKRSEVFRKSRSAKPLAEQQTALADGQTNARQNGPYPKPNTKTKELPPLIPLQGEDGVGVLDDEFQAWWEGYPRQVGKQAALEAYRKARQETSAEQLAIVLASARAKWQADKTEARYILHPANWLEQRRWQDPVKEVETAASEPIELMRLAAGSLMATQSPRRYQALLQRIGQRSLIELVSRFDGGSDTRDLFLAVERAASTEPAAEAA